MFTNSVTQFGEIVLQFSDPLELEHLEMLLGYECLSEKQIKTFKGRQEVERGYKKIMLRVRGRIPCGQNAVSSLLTVHP
jgi:hypothetical protein